MLTISLHSICIYAYKGLYPEEKIIGNQFEVDVDIMLHDNNRGEFVDYTLIRQVVDDVFDKPGDTLETLVFEIHSTLRFKFPVSEQIKVVVRKLNPPMQGRVADAQVCYEA